MPDIFVPLGGDNDIGFFNRVFNRGHIYTFAFDYADRNRVEVESHDTAEGFVRGFTIDVHTYRDFLRYVEEKGTDIPDHISTEARTQIETNLKAYIGRNIFGPEAFYPVLHTTDRAFKKALEALESEEMQMLTQQPAL